MNGWDHHKRDGLHVLEKRVEVAGRPSPIHARHGDHVEARVTFNGLDSIDVMIDVDGNAERYVRTSIPLDMFENIRLRKRKEETERLTAAGFVPYGGYGWWRRANADGQPGGGPSLTREQCLRRLLAELRPGKAGK